MKAFHGLLMVTEPQKVVSSYVHMYVLIHVQYSTHICTVQSHVCTCTYHGTSGL